MQIHDKTGTPSESEGSEGLGGVQEGQVRYAQEPSEKTGEKRKREEESAEKYQHVTEISTYKEDNEDGTRIPSSKARDSTRPQKRVRGTMEEQSRGKSDERLGEEQINEGVCYIDGGKALKKKKDSLPRPPSGAKPGKRRMLPELSVGCYANASHPEPPYEKQGKGMSSTVDYRGPAKPQLYPSAIQQNLGYDFARSPRSAHGLHGMLGANNMNQNFIDMSRKTKRR